MMKEYLDVYALEEYFKKTKLNRFLKDKYNLFNIALIMSMQVSACALQQVPSSIFSSICSFVSYFNLWKKWNTLNTPMYLFDEIANALRETSTYKECLGLYKEYVHDLAEFIKQFSFINPQEIFLYFDFLFASGFLSYNMKNSFYNYANDFIFLDELLGARVLSGKSVCKNRASLVTDVFGELGYKSIAIVCGFIDSDCFDNFFFAPEWDHVVVGVMNGDKKLVYDPTNELIFGKVELVNGEEITSPYIVQEPYGRVLLLKEDHPLFNRSRTNDIHLVMQSSVERFSREDLVCLRRKMEDLLSVSKIQNILGEGDAFQFFNKNKKKCEEIARLEKELHPYSDNPILEYKVRR